MIERIHILALPHSQVSMRYCRDAYEMKVLKLCKMLVGAGLKVYLYASEENETPAELVTCVSKQTQAIYGHATPETYNTLVWDKTNPLWKIFHKNAIAELGKRVQPGDIIGTFAGLCDEEIMLAFPQCRFVELGIGYDGIIGNSFHVFESHAWLNTVCGKYYGASGADGRFYDTVIPNYFEPNDFPYSETHGDYVLFVGRMIGRKGLEIVNAVAKRMPNTQFILAGQGARVDGNVIVYDEWKNADGKAGCSIMDAENLKYIGVIDAEQRGKFMSEAKALICPTIYVAPFEGVHVEAMMCGTPVVTSPFGAFTETYEQGKQGFKCRNISDFVSGIERADSLDRPAIRQYAQSRYAADVVVKQYLDYFALLDGIGKGGFYA